MRLKSPRVTRSAPLAIWLSREVHVPLCERLAGKSRRSTHRADKLRQVAQLYCPQTRLRMTVATDQHAMQVYSGNHLAGSGHYRAHQGICFETQHCPDAPNQPDFPSAVLRPGESYRHTTRFSFDQVPAQAIMAP